MQDMIDAQWAISMMKGQVNDKCMIHAPFMHDVRTIYARFLHNERNAHVVHVYRLFLHDNRQGLMHDKFNYAITLQLWSSTMCTKPPWKILKIRVPWLNEVLFLCIFCTLNWFCLIATEHLVTKVSIEKLCKISCFQSFTKMVRCAFTSTWVQYLLHWILVPPVEVQYKTEL